MRKRIALSILGVFLIQSFAMGSPAFASWHGAERNTREARRDSQKAAGDRADARIQAREGHHLRAKLKRMAANHHEKRAIHNRRQARKDLYR